MRDLLGGKGAGLAEMTRLGLAVPLGFTITTKACNAYSKSGRFPPGMWKQVDAALSQVESKGGRRFGDPANPLLVSVRSGAKISMPGMMDTVLNIGLNDSTVDALAQVSNERFAWDAYRRLVSMYGRIVKEIDGRKFEAILDRHKEKSAARKDTDLGLGELKAVVADFKDLYRREVGEEFPAYVKSQLRESVAAIFRSWRGKRAVDYRNFNKIPHTLGPAANIQMMVFGNMGPDSGTGVAFTRNQVTGAKELYGEYLPNAQGEDVVAGIRTPTKIAELRGSYPEIYADLSRVAERLENHFREAQDIEFTVERGKLWILQTRAAKPPARAAVRIALDMVRERLVTKQEALLRIKPDHVIQLLLPQFDEAAKAEARRAGLFLAKGLNASPGAAMGVVAFDPDEAARIGRDEAKPVILVRLETSPDDVHGILHSKGVLTARGGATSHAAVVTRGLGIPCVAGCEAIQVDYDAAEFRVGDKVVRRGEHLAIDGSTGEVFAGAIRTIAPDFEREGDRRRDLEGRLAELDSRLGDLSRRYLGSLERIGQMQRDDFVGILREMAGLPVIIRLIDPPLHEFLPRYETLLVQVTKLRIAREDPEAFVRAATSEEDRTLIAEVRKAGSDLAKGIESLLPRKERLLEAVKGSRETNPMLGLRGCRLGIMFPEITEMQVRAIFEAACRLKKEGVDVRPEIMIPLVGLPEELRIERHALEKEAKSVMDREGISVDYKFGTMIEIPRAALVADAIARHAEFFSFGTNDLTQTTMGYSRDDAEPKFLLDYVEQGILPRNPFQTIDRDGVGQLMRMCVQKGRKVRRDLEIGICGEHGGDPASIEFCHAIGLNYVSCSPFRVPVARLAAAHAKLRQEAARAKDA